MQSIQPEYKSPTEVAPDIFLVPIPIPIPLRYTNCYLCRGPSGWTLVDTGYRDSLSENAWPRALDELGIRMQDIDRILVTHYHADHVGAAGWLQQLSGAPAYIYERELDLVELFLTGSRTAQRLAVHDLFLAEGMPAETADAMLTILDKQSHFTPMAEFISVPDGSQLRIGKLEYEIIWTPGHTDGLPVFWNEETGILMANDMILNKITPNVSLWPNCRPNPLQDYVDSLTKVEALGAKIALTGHRAIFTNVSERAGQIRQHHADRLNKMAQLCTGAQGATAWEVCDQVFSTLTLTLHQIRFAMSETLAHMSYMEQEGRLLKKGNRYVHV